MATLDGGLVRTAGAIGSLRLEAAHVDEEGPRPLLLRPSVVAFGRRRPRLAQVLDEKAGVAQHPEPRVERAVDLVERHPHAVALDDVDRALHVEVRPALRPVAARV